MSNRYRIRQPVEEAQVQGYVVTKGDRFYAVIYEGVDPITGRERRRWHAAGQRPRRSRTPRSRLGDRGQSQ